MTRPISGHAGRRMGRCSGRGVGRASVVLSAVLSLASTAAQAQEQGTGEEEGIVLDTVFILSAEQQLKQMPGVSTITASDLEQRPVTNDISEIIRRMPGANLTGTSASGQRGNQRQIDLRGMGPENTLILIDGKPVLSRNSVRMGRGGERDSRGDSNWVPAEAIERIEVIRGPAAARYGSGAAGGVVNIITKKPETLSGSASTYVNVPQDSKEGHTVRGNFLVGGPINETTSFRLMGNYSRTQNDAADINAAASAAAQANPPAGREGVVNRDIRGVLTFEPTDDHAIDIEAAYSRQGNLFAGDSQNAATGANAARLSSLVGEETNSLKRGSLAATHRGTYDFGESTSYIQWERTRNTRLAETLAGGSEGSISGDLTNSTIELDTLTAKSEWILPLDTLFEQKLTIGTEYRGEWMHDPVSAAQPGSSSVSYPTIPAIPRNLDPDSSDWLIGLYAEDNISVTDDFTLTPGLRFDQHSAFGSNLSPSLNASYTVTETIILKAGIARAFKAPNLFQQNPEYILFSNGNGCAVRTTGGCYIIGNENLEPETSINKEIGISYNDDLGWNAGLTYFHNDYRNRISPSTIAVAGLSTAAVNVYQWDNVPEAVVSGLEGNVSVPLHEKLTWATNFTYMIQSENKSDGQPLSLVPDYTINTSLEWKAREDVTLILSATHYGETQSPTARSFNGSVVDNPEPRKPYTLVNLGASYEINETYRMTAGINNVFNERVYREGSGNNAGANTYNEPGRSFYVSLAARF
ncbi:FepA family TonB-dependent siderophore receptor [Rhizobium sp. FY34]|uniref:FepA family TonB-dependent siderophore receptor n=1 Tax=Rhizobium sp. FY34 TaxID=2562309 RepID=UPI001981165C|nr:FepA family TonB-dependent siderophore receptor [Rhizobium sp. FY34]